VGAGVSQLSLVIMPCSGKKLPTLPLTLMMAVIWQRVFQGPQINCLKISSLQLMRPELGFGTPIAISYDTQ
jgi:hypothetical protein